MITLPIVVKLRGGANPESISRRGFRMEHVADGYMALYDQSVLIVNAAMLKATLGLPEETTAEEFSSSLHAKAESIRAAYSRKAGVHAIFAHTSVGSSAKFPKYGFFWIMPDKAFVSLTRGGVSVENWGLGF